LKRTLAWKHQDQSKAECRFTKLSFKYVQIYFSYRKIVLRALPNLKKLDNVEVTPEEVKEALRGPLPDIHQQQQQQKQEEPYDEDYESSYRQQAATSGFRGHSPVREVKLWAGKYMVFTYDNTQHII
jgi:hypothetical protein